MSSRRVMSDDLKTIEFETSEDVDVTPTFDNMGMREELLRGVYAYGKFRLVCFKNHVEIFKETDTRKLSNFGFFCQTVPVGIYGLMA